MRKVAASLLLLAALAPLSSTAFADPVPASRQADWTFTGVPGGIPKRTTICATFSPGVTAAAINNALKACNNGVVYLNAGTYSAASLGGPIQFNASNVTLRGAGADKTILTGNTIVNFGVGSATNIKLGTAITSGAAKGSRTFTVASTASLSVGSLIEIDRDDDTSLVVNTGKQAGGTRNLTQVNAITAINGNTVTVRNPFFYNFSTGNPKVKFYFTGVPAKSGVEDLKFDHTGFTGGGYNAFVQYCDSCWLKGIESTNATGYHFILLGTLNMELRDSFIHDGGTGPNNSGFNFFGNYLYGANSNGRIENNIFNKNFPAIEMNGASNGFFIGYNYAHGTADYYGSALVTWTYDDGHAPFNIMNLYEGNIGEMFGMDGYFGGSGYGTVLRNYFTGYNPNNGAVGDAIQIKRLGYYYSFVGNVLGSTNQRPGSYQTGCGNLTIFQLGYPNIGNCDTAPYDGFNVAGGYPDAKVSSTLLRWGNYDYFNKTTRFVASEMPAGVAAPADRIIPDSYVYSAKPGWWPSTVAWPPIGPDVTGGNGDTSGHVFKTPAQICWDNVVATGAFNAASCFVAGSGSGTGVPAITSAKSASATETVAFSYKITASNTPTSFKATPLPAGLTLNATTGAITGTPTTVGNYSVKLTATNAKGSGTATLALSVNALTIPTITSALTASGNVDAPFTYTIKATGSPTRYGATKLPAGLSVNATTGVISGTPTVTGTFNVALTAYNAKGTGRATLALTVDNASYRLFGTGDVQPSIDSNAAGVAEAFQTSAIRSGTARLLYVYLDAASTASKLVVGVYADASGRPGALISQASSTSLRPGRWNGVTLPGAPIIAGRSYWIAILGANGVLRFRDGAGGCRAENSAQTTLTALPASWTSGRVWSSCPLAALGRS